MPFTTVSIKVSVPIKRLGVSANADKATCHRHAGLCVILQTDTAMESRRFASRRENDNYRKNLGDRTRGKRSKVIVICCQFIINSKNSVIMELIHLHTGTILLQ